MTILIAQHNQQASLIPDWVTDLQSFRRWACSDDFPESGWYAHLDGHLWVDTSMERLGHNRVKTAIGTALDVLTKSTGTGMYLSDRMLLTHVGAGLSTEPDGMFLGYETIRQGRAQLEQGDRSMEVVGTPDMVLEVVSTTSGRKDKVLLPVSYFRAGIPEYWISESAGDGVTLQIFRRGDAGYENVPSLDGWIRSSVFEKEFRLTAVKDPLGLPLYELQIR